MFSPRITCPWSTYYARQELFSILENALESLWSGRWQTELNMYDVSSLLPVEIGTATIYLGTSKMKRKEARGVNLLWISDESEKPVVYYYGSHVFFDPRTHTQLNKVYGECKVVFIVEQIFLRELSISRTRL